jgi:hypothetical protein
MRNQCRAWITIVQGKTCVVGVATHLDWQADEKGPDPVIPIPHCGIGLEFLHLTVSRRRTRNRG